MLGCPGEDYHQYSTMPMVAYGREWCVPPGPMPLHQPPGPHANVVKKYCHTSNIIRFTLYHHAYGLHKQSNNLQQISVLDI